MALIQCPECRAEVSDKAPVCPRCGYPIAAESAPPPEEGGVRAGLAASGLQDELRRRTEAQAEAVRESQSRRDRTLRLLRFLSDRGNPGGIRCAKLGTISKKPKHQSEADYFLGWVLEAKPWGNSDTAQVMLMLADDGMLRTVGKSENGHIGESPFIEDEPRPAALPDTVIADLLLRLGIRDIPPDL